MNGFRKLPTWWFREEKLKCFQGGLKAGESIAALKVLISISLHADFHTREADISFSSLEEITGLSRPMVIKGVKKLEEEKIVHIDRTGNTNRYTMNITHNDAKWAKVPFNLVKNKLRHISNRGIPALGALKIYISLLALRDNHTPQVKISYEKIRSWTGLQSSHIRPSLDILFNHSIIHIQKSEELDFENDDKTAHNIYKIMGNLMLKQQIIL